MYSLGQIIKCSIHLFRQKLVFKEVYCGVLQWLYLESSLKKK